MCERQLIFLSRSKEGRTSTSCSGRRTTYSVRLVLQSLLLGVYRVHVNNFGSGAACRFMIGAPGQRCDEMQRICFIDVGRSAMWAASSLQHDTVVYLNLQSRL